MDTVFVVATLPKRYYSIILVAHYKDRLVEWENCSILSVTLIYNNLNTKNCLTMHTKNYIYIYICIYTYMYIYIY